MLVQAAEITVVEDAAGLAGAVLIVVAVELGGEDEVSWATTPLHPSDYLPSSRSQNTFSLHGLPLQAPE